LEPPHFNPPSRTLSSDSDLKLFWHDVSVVVASVEVSVTFVVVSIEVSVRLVSIEVSVSPVANVI